MLSYFKAILNDLQACLAGTNCIKCDNIKSAYTRAICSGGDIYAKDFLSIRVWYMTDLYIRNTYAKDTCSISVIKYLEIYL